MSKRTLIIAAVALVAIVATYLSFKYDRRVNQEPTEEPEPEPDEEPDKEPEPTPEPAPVKENKTVLPDDN